MVAPWEAATGAKVNYTGTRDLAGPLTTGDRLRQPARRRRPARPRPHEGVVRRRARSSRSISSTSPRTRARRHRASRTLGKASDGKLLGIFTKAAVKGLIWYNTANLDGRRTRDLGRAEHDRSAAATGDTKEWCIGVESGGASGWPGTDWIEDIVLRQAGPDVYDGWVAGTTQVDRSRDQGGLRDVRRRRREHVRWLRHDRRRRTSARPRTRCSRHRPAACSTTRPASSPTSSRTRRGRRAEQFDFFRDPRHRPRVRRARSRRRRPVRDVQRHAAGPVARSSTCSRPRPRRSGSSAAAFISANKNVPADAYPDEASKRSAEILANAQIFRFDASRPHAERDERGVLRGHRRVRPEPGDLDSILANLDTGPGGRLQPVADRRAWRPAGDRPPCRLQAEG